MQLSTGMYERVGRKGVNSYRASGSAHITAQSGQTYLALRNLASAGPSRLRLVQYNTQCSKFMLQ